MTPREVDMKKAVSCHIVPAIGPYSSAVKAGPFIFCSGQIPLVPDTGEVITADVRRATEQAMRNLEAVLAAAGATLADVVKTTIYLVDMGDFPAVNEVYGRFFTAEPPARATVQVARLPREAPIEIEAVAFRPPAFLEETDDLDGP
ncbi:MAG TPA: Rid family detoxifying hydrolase [Syntrophales bacterium]|nr:Rid family detoxifying hydrolase [Syntrophales bacterium]HPQ06878.1 Rid family detoxifying hydrolase [Syntrophales bacterium]